MAEDKKTDTHRVLPNPDGGWDVKRDGAERAYRHFDIKQDAIGCAREVSRNQETELRIHNRDGQIGQCDSHGNDPRNIKG